VVSAGGINAAGEQLKETMLRELQRIGLGDIWVEQLKTFDRPPQYVDGTLTVPGRDPRGRVISVAYVGLVSPDRALLPQMRPDSPGCRSMICPSWPSIMSRLSSTRSGGCGTRFCILLSPFSFYRPSSR
jgi:hypothetical protein